MGGECVDCCTKDLEILEFDHVRGTKIDCVRKISSYEGMKSEAGKCDLRCSNCHFKKIKVLDVNEDYDISTNIKRYRKIAKDYVREVKINSGGCSSCGWYDLDYLQVLHFDHLDENEKSYNISRLVSTGKSIALIKSEIEKCRILCANCHRKRTLRQYDYPVLGMINNII
jgi:hypothetical protein